MKPLAFEIRVRADHPSLAGHFPGQPIVPGVLLLDQVMLGLSASTGREVVRVQRMKFISAQLPDETASAQCVIEGDRASFTVHVVRGDQRVLLAEGLALLSPGAGS